VAVAGVPWVHPAGADRTEGFLWAVPWHFGPASVTAVSALWCRCTAAHLNIRMMTFLQFAGQEQYSTAQSTGDGKCIGSGEARPSLRNRPESKPSQHHFVAAMKAAARLRESGKGE